MILEFLELLWLNFHFKYLLESNKIVKKKKKKNLKSYVNKDCWETLCFTCRQKGLFCLLWHKSSWLKQGHRVLDERAGVKVRIGGYVFHFHMWYLKRTSVAMVLVNKSSVPIYRGGMVEVGWRSKREMICMYTYSWFT